MAIFKGRLLALLLLIVYHYAFGFSKTFGIAVITLIFASMPWLIRSALRFRLRNTSYRGLRFNFNGTILGAYLSYAPMLLILVFPACFVALFPDKRAWLLFGLGILYLCWPLIHARMKVYQHSHLQYGDQRSTYSGNAISLLKTYVIAFALGFALVLLFILFTGLGVSMWVGINKVLPNQASFFEFYLLGIFSLIYAYIVYLFLDPYFHAFGGVDEIVFLTVPDR